MTFALLVIPQYRATADEQNRKSDELLVEAAAEGNQAELEELLESGVQINARNDDEGATALMHAAQNGRVAVLRYLIQKGAAVNEQDYLNGATALMYVASNEGPEEGKPGLEVPMSTKIEVVQALISAGADVNTQNQWGGTALQWAADAGNDEIVASLLRAKADATLADDDGLSPLMAAANYDGPQFLRIVQALLAAGAKVDAFNSRRETALFYAMNNFTADNSQALLKAGANVNHKNESGLTPLMRASQLSRAELVRALIQAGADLNAKRNDGLSVLGVAQAAGYEEIVQILREAGAR